MKLKKLAGLEMVTPHQNEAYNESCLSSSTRRVAQILFTFFVLTTCLLPQGFVVGQGNTDQPSKAPSLKIQIADQPIAIDPALTLPKELAAKKNVKFDETSLKEVVQWLKDETQFHVVLDARSFRESGILSSEPVNDRLVDEPVHLLLDRLKSLGIHWRWDGKVIHLSSDEPLIFTQQYNIGDLRDLGFEPEEIKMAIENCIDSDSWADTSTGDGSIVILGDVMFVRQYQMAHRRIAGLLAALKKPGRQTMVFAPSGNQKLYESLNQNISVDFNETPLIAVVERLCELSKADVRLDYKSLKGIGVRSREPITLKIENQPLRLVLNLICMRQNMQWKVEDSVLWVTSQSSIEMVTGVYDVRDLCRSRQEANALLDAIESQAMPDSWMNSGQGDGSIMFPLPGTMVVCQIAKGQDEVLELLENYRKAFRNSKPRDQEDQNPIETRYYRVPTSVAVELSKVLPELVQPETWLRPEDETAPGKIRVLKSWNELLDAQNGKPNGQFMIEFSAMIVQQRRETHREIALLIRKIQSGDGFQGLGGIGGGGFGGGKGGGGGFGGGFF